MSQSASFIPQMYIQLIPYIRWSTSGGVVSVFVPAVWKLIIPYRVQFFLRLLPKDKILARNNLSKRQNMADSSCLFVEGRNQWFICFLSVWWQKKSMGVVS
jgi:hypothetical protein